MSLLWVAFGIFYQVTSMQIITRNDTMFATYRLEEEWASYYGSLEERDTTFNPHKIFIPETEDDIVSIVQMAAHNSASVVVKSGGHHYIGASSCSDSYNCYQIDMKHFNKTEFVRNETNHIISIKVGVGQKLGKLYELLYPHGVAILGGNCEGLGVGGHYQSSSLGTWSRSLGLGMDWIKSVTLINANGEKQVVSKYSDLEADRDLFWAILGGSPGSFGVILEYEFDPIRDSDYPHSYAYRFLYYYSKDTFSTAANAMMNVLNNALVNEIQDIGAMYIGVVPILYDPNNAATHASNLVSFTITWTGIHNGDIFGAIPNTNTTWYQEILGGFDSVPGLVLRSVSNGSVPISLFLYLSLAPESIIPVEPYRYYLQHSSFDKNDLNQLMNDKNSTQWLNHIVDAVNAAVPVDGTNHIDNDLCFQFWNFNTPTDVNPIINGTQIDQYNPMNNAVSYSGRNIAFEADNYILFGNHHQETNVSVLNKALETRETLERLIGGNTEIETFAFPDIGYIDLSTDHLDKEWRKYYQGNQQVYDKLRKVKTKVDPNNIFNGPLTIKPIVSIHQRNQAKRNHKRHHKKQRFKHRKRSKSN